MAVRRATPADIARLHALVESAYRGDSAKRGWTHEADLLGGQRTDPQALAEMIGDPANAILLASSGDDLVGCVAVSKKPAGRAYLGLLTVDPTRQAGGLGKVLLHAAEAHAKDHFGATRMEMTVIKQRGELIAYYERRGYANTGREAPFPLDDPRFGIPKTRDLVFVVLEKPLG
jgi:GNAT superfamily N-acetyltransferase